MAFSWMGPARSGRASARATYTSSPISSPWTSPLRCGRRRRATMSSATDVTTPLGGYADPAIGKALAVLRQFSGQPEATVIGRAERLDALNAAFINAAAANVFDFDDTHLP